MTQGLVIRTGQTGPDAIYHAEVAFIHAIFHIFVSTYPDGPVAMTGPSPFIRKIRVS